MILVKTISDQQTNSPAHIYVSRDKETGSKGDEEVELLRLRRL